MDVLFVVLAGMGAVIGWAIQASFTNTRERARMEARSRVAAACGLTRIGRLHDWSVAGVHGALRIRMETAREARQASMRVVIDGIVRNVQIVPAGRGGTADLVFGDRDVEVGDPFFDAELLLQGPAAAVRGLFSAFARERARSVFAMDARVRIGGGTLTAEFADPAQVPAPAEWQLKELLALAHSLEPGATDVARLAEIGLRDPQPAVRAMALETLAKEAPESPRTRDVLRQAMRDASPAIRLQAARATGDEGRPTLHALAADPTIDDGTSAGAVVALGGYLTFARATPLLDRAVVDGRAQTACALLKVMGRGGLAEAQVIASVLARVNGTDAAGEPSANAAIAQAALESLLDTRVPLAEGPFLAALASPSPEIVLAATRGLERVGTVRAVPSLRDVEARGGDLARGARMAIGAIKSRLTGATPGQVSLASGTGELSVVESPDGRVTLGDE
jgi:hypothetical protein